MVLVSYMMVITPTYVGTYDHITWYPKFLFIYLNLIYIKLESTNITLDSITITYDSNYIIVDNNNWVEYQTHKKSEYCRMILIFLLNFFLGIYIYKTYYRTYQLWLPLWKRPFSAMKIVNNWLRSRMSDQWIDDNLILYIGRDIFRNINNKIIM